MYMKEIVLCIIVILLMIKICDIILKERSKVKRIRDNVKKIKSSKSSARIIQVDNSKTNIFLKDIILARFYYLGRFKYIKDIQSGKTKYACGYINKKTIRKEERKSISHIKPKGWQKNTTTQVYNRCHLIASILGGADSKQNLITATRKLNELMIPYEYKIKKYVLETKKPVVYTVIPVYLNDNLLCKGVLIEAYSVCDKGRSINFNVFIANKQDDVKINYRSGEYTEKLKLKTKIKTNKTK